MERGAGVVCEPGEAALNRTVCESVMGTVELPLFSLVDDVLEMRGQPQRGRSPGLLRSSWYCVTSARLRDGLVVQPGSSPLPSPSPPLRLDSDGTSCAELSACADGPAAEGSVVRRRPWSQVSLRLKRGLSVTSDMVQLGLNRVDRVVPWLLKTDSDVVLGVELPCLQPAEDCLSVCSWGELFDVDIFCSAEEAKEQLPAVERPSFETV